MLFGRLFSPIVCLIAGLCSTASAEELLRLTNLWSAPLAPGTISSPALGANGNIYISDRDGHLLAFNPDGSRRWALKLTAEITASPAVADDGTILVGGRNRRLHAVTYEGRQRWAFKTGGWVDGCAAISEDGTVYFGSWDGKLYALTLDGRKKWEFATSGPVLSSPAIDPGGVIYFGSNDGRLYALNPDGSKRWEFPTRGQIISSPAIANHGNIIFTSLDGRLYALDGEGRQRWVLHTSGITAASPAIGPDDTVYLGINSNHCAVTAAGQLKWEGRMSPDGYVPPDWIASTPAVIGDGMPIVTGTDLLMIIFTPEGRWHRAQSLLSGSRSSACIGPDGTIYAASTLGKLLAFQGLAPLAESSWPMFRGDPAHRGRARGVR